MNRSPMTPAEISHRDRSLADATRQRDAALSTLASITDALDLEGVPTTLPPEEEGDDTIILSTPRRVLWLANQWGRIQSALRSGVLVKVAP